jgi:histone-lysine N-methyltransferase SETD3
MALSARAARESADVGPIAKECGDSLGRDDVLALFIMHERRKGANSAHAEHIDSIPREYDQTLFWADNELAEIVGSNVHALTQSLAVQVREDHEALLKALESSAYELTLLADTPFTLEEYRWALATIWSRSMDIAVAVDNGADADGSMRVIVPVADMFNTSKETTEAVHFYDPNVDSLKILAAADSVPQDQLMICYGKLSNARAAWLYGFVIPENPEDDVELYATMTPETKSYDRRVALLEELGRTVESLAEPHKLTMADPLPMPLRVSLRVQVRQSRTF